MLELIEGNASTELLLRGPAEVPVLDACGKGDRPKSAGSDRLRARSGCAFMPERRVTLYVDREGENRMLHGCAVRSKVAQRACSFVCIMVAGCGTSPSSVRDTAELDAADPLARAYVAGETQRFLMTGINQSRESMLVYSAACESLVVADAGGSFYEEFRWTGAEVGGQAIALDPESLDFRQRLSLDARAAWSMPDISRVNPLLIGPILDLMTIYVDLSPGLRAAPLNQAGDRVRVPHGVPNSWADGTHVVIGEDAIDFELTLLDVAEDSATLLVRHVPPGAADASINLPVAWMHERVGEAANNWVQVQRDSSGGDSPFVAAVGMETFDVTITIERPSGRIVSALLENPVDVLQRSCRDETLLSCGDPVRYRIYRRVELAAVP